MKDLSWGEIKRGHQWNGDWSKKGSDSLIGDTEW
tara:strand:+ start:193 stop:294 length:102 start_codon:yes stop_codon:yes gene_type:complete